MARRSTGQLTEVKSKTTGNVTSYGVRFTVDGKRRYVTLRAETRRDAELEMQDFMTDVRRGGWMPPEQRIPEPEQRVMPTFAEFASEWYRDRCVEAGWREDDEEAGPLERYREQDYWRLKHLSSLGTFRLDEITVETVDRYRQRKVREGRLNASSINRLISTLATILEVAMDREYVTRNVAAGRNRKLKNRKKPKRVYLRRAEHIAALIEGAAVLDRQDGRRRLPWRRALVTVLVFTGVRIDEALSLQWQHLDLACGVIYVPGTKTEAAVDRPVRILPVLRDELTELAAARPNRQPGDLVFGTARAGKRYTGAKKQSASNVRARVLSPAIEEANAALAKAGKLPLPEGVTPHALRRTFASILVALGYDQALVMRSMGHTSAAFTMEVYAQAMDADEGDRDRLRALVNGEEWQGSGNPTADVALGLSEGYMPRGTKTAR